MVAKFTRFRRVFHRRSTVTVVAFLLSCLSCLWFFGFVYQETEPIEYHHVRFGKHDECRHYKTMPKASDGRKKLILFYTPIYGRFTVFYPEEYQCCEPLNCEITTDKSKLLESDAVVFHGRDLPLAKQMPKRRTPRQRWVFFTHESPYHSKIVASEYNGMFNWTMTYERRADLYIPYWHYTRKDPDTNLKGPPQRNFAEGKDKLLVFVNSHCQTIDGLREEFVRALNRIVRVDIYGECGGIFGRASCPRWSERCGQMLKRYKFYISLENGICNDYITEKYWQVPFDHDAVPIVLSLKFFKELTIPGSYIDANAFPDVNSLVKYLKYLDKNDTAYNEYFKWRQFYQTADMEPWPCRMCRMLHNGSLPVKSYKRFDQFLDPNIVCTKSPKIKF
jgi:galactoside alpha-1,3-fucosyltransferase 4